MPFTVVTPRHNRTIHSNPVHHHLFKRVSWVTGCRIKNTKKKYEKSGTTSPSLCNIRVDWLKCHIDVPGSKGRRADTQIKSREEEGG